MNIEQIKADDPFQPAHWRLDLAREIAAGEYSDPGQMSPALTAAVQHLRTGTDGPERNEDVAAAIRLHESDSPTQWLTEALLLAGSSTEDIHDRVGIPAAVIDLFAALCFSVREFPRAKDWIASRILRWKHMTGFQNDDLREFWLWSGWSGGQLAVDQLVDVFPGGLNGPGEALMSSYLLDSQVPEKLQSYVAISVLPASGHGASWTIELGEQYEEAREAADPAAALVRHRQRTIQVARCLLTQRALPPLPRRENRGRRFSPHLVLLRLQQELTPGQSVAEPAGPAASRAATGVDNPRESTARRDKEVGGESSAAAKAS